MQDNPGFSLSSQRATSSLPLSLWYNRSHESEPAGTSSGSRWTTTKAPICFRAVEEKSIMTFRRGSLFTRAGFRSPLAIVLAVLGLGQSCGGASHEQAQPSANAPIPPREAVTADEAARGFHGQLVRRRARRRAADRHDHRPQRPALGRRELFLSDLAGGAARQGPHPDLRGRRQRRAVRSPDGLLRQGDQLHRASSSASAASGSAPRPTCSSSPTATATTGPTASRSSSSTAGIRKRNITCSTD